MRGDTPLRRAVDLLLSAPALLLLAPLLGAIALAVRLESPGPALFQQRRVGRQGRSFAILKFRSMVRDAERLGPQISGRRDPRITRVGRLLRGTKLDELPQLVNVARGEMTLIGPRAEVPDMVREYTAEERDTLLVRPGLTGPGQLHFTTEQAAALDAAADAEAWYREHQLHAKLALDLEYLRRRSLAADLRLLARTVAAMVGAAGRGRNA